MGEGNVDSVELVIASHDLEGLPTSVVLEDDEMTEVIEETGLIEKAINEDIQLRSEGAGDLGAGDSLPGHETLFIGGKRADAGFETIGDDEGFVVCHEGGNLGFVSLELVECAPDGGGRVGGILELEDGQGETVDKYDEVGTAGVMIFENGELVNHEPVVVIDVVEIKEVNSVADDAAIFGIFHGDTVDKSAVKDAVGGEEGGGWEIDKFFEGVFDS